MHPDLDNILGDPLKLPGEPESNNRRPGPRKRSFSKRLLFIPLGLLLLAGAGLAGWKYIIQKEPAQQASPASEANAVPHPDEAEQLTKHIDETSEKIKFESTKPRLAIEHPANWEVSETEDSGLLIESPVFTYPTVSGTDTEGNFRIYIRQGARTEDSKYIGRGVVVQPTEKLVYTDPAPGQRTETNLSLFGLDTPDHFAYFLIAGNFDLKKGDTLGPDYGKEPLAYIITGGFSSPELEDDFATNKVPLDMAQKSNAYKIALGIVSSLKVY